MPVRLVAFDLDGTMLEAGRRLAPGLVGALRALAAAGIRCTTATGRPLSFQLELFPRFGLGPAAGVPHALMADERELFLLRDGAYVPQPAWNEVVRRRWRELGPLAHAWLERAAAEAARRGYRASIQNDDGEIYERGLPTLAFASSGEAEAIRAWLAAALETTGVPLACNRNARLVQLQDRLAGKGNVLAALAQHWQLAPHEVLAIGDSVNDLSMLDGRHGFRSATVANADDAIKAAVRAAGGYVAGARLGDGVIECLRALGVIPGVGRNAGTVIHHRG